MAEEITVEEERPGLRSIIEQHRPIREKVREKYKGKPDQSWKNVLKPATELLVEEARIGRTDILTGLLNLRGLIERLNAEVETARRTGIPLAMVFLDLDNFKVLNDTFGHPQGNVYLKHLAPRLKDVIRPTDTVSRPGGDEFIFLLHDRGNVIEVAKRLIKAVEEDPEGPKFWGQKPITASIGATVINIRQDIGEKYRNKEKSRKKTNHIRNNMFDQADIAMYHAKKAGKDTFVIFKRGMQMPKTEHGRFRTSS